MRSIKNKLAILVSTAVLSAVVVGSHAAAWRDADRSVNAKRDELIDVAAVLAATISEPLARDDRKAVARAMTSISGLPNIRFARVTDAQNRLVAELGAGAVVARDFGSIEASPKLSPLSALYLGTYPIATEVVSGGKKVGRLVVIADVAHLKQALINSLLSSLSVGLIIALLGIAAAIRFQRRITHPITSLTAAMKEVGARKDFNAVVPKSSNDEIGDLVDSFNAMLTEIRIRDDALAAHRDQLEATVAVRTAELEKAKDEAESANAAKSDFLATMSHEIRTPMNGMLVMAELMTVSGLPPRIQRYADVLLNSGKSLLAIINDILDFSKIEAGKLTLEAIPASPKKIVDGILKLFSERAASKGLDLAAYIAPNVPATVAADPVRCTQILSNLVNNALKFTSDGGIFVSLECREGAAPAEAVLEFSVIDTGIGIPQDKIATIFDAFSQLDQSTTRKYGGTGIGLTICQRLAEAMGGTIFVDSEEGVGSTFVVTVAAEVIDEAPSQRSPGATPHGLVVIARHEDSPTTIALEAYARDFGWEAIAVAPDALTSEIVRGARAVFADSAVLPALFANMPETLGVDREAVVVALSGFGEGRKTAHEASADLALELPLAHADTIACMEVIGFDRATIAAARALYEPSAAAPTIQNLRSFAGCRVLVADDSAVNRELLAEALGRVKFDVVCVEDGAQAVEAVKNGAFDIVFLDGSMPVMDGFAAARALRAWEYAQNRDPLPIIAVTAHIIGDRAAEWRDAGMTDCLTKPFTLATLQSCAERHLPAAEGQVAEWNAQMDVAPVPQIPEASEKYVAAHQVAPPPLVDESAIVAMREMQQPGDDFASRMIELYESHAPRALAKLQEADLVASDLEGVASAAHALKSLSLSIGASRVAAVCEDLERGAMRGDAGQAAHHLGALQEVMPRTLAALAALCREGKKIEQTALSA